MCESDFFFSFFWLAVVRLSTLCKQQFSPSMCGTDEKVNKYFSVNRIDNERWNCGRQPPPKTDTKTKHKIKLFHWGEWHKQKLYIKRTPEAALHSIRFKFWTKCVCSRLSYCWAIHSRTLEVHNLLTMPHVGSCRHHYVGRGEIDCPRDATISLD